MENNNELFGFEEFHQKDESKIENVNIKQVILYYEASEHKDFYKLSKQLIKKIYPENYKDKNVSDLILKILKEEL